MTAQQTILTPDLDAIRAHLTAWAAPYIGTEYDDGMIEIAHSAPGDPAVNRARLFPIDQIEAAVAYAADQNARRCNVYVGAALRAPGAAPYERASALDFYAAAFACAEADDDADAVAARIEAMGTKGAIRVRTGQTPEKRVHHWLRLRELCDDPEDYGAALVALVAHVGADAKVKDSARVLRLGGTVNWITDPRKAAKGYVDELIAVVVEDAPAVDLYRLAALEPMPGWAPKSSGGGGGNGGPGEIIRNADGLVTDGREAFWRQLVLGAVAEFQRKRNRDPAVDDVFNVAFARFVAETVGDDRWTCPRGQGDLRKRASNTLRRLRSGHLARFGLWSRQTGIGRQQAEEVQAQRDRDHAASSDAPDARPFEDILADAQALTPDDLDRIEEITAEAAALNSLRQDQVFRAIKAATGIGLTTLRAQVKTEAGPEPDHLDLARAAITRMGRDNVLCAGPFVWRWDAAGVWRQQDDRAIKQVVQAVIDGEQEDVTATLVNGVADVLKSEIFKPDHEFNRGNPECVNCPSGEIELDRGQWVLRPHRREHYRTTQIPVPYDPAADAPMFHAFLGQVFRDDLDRADKIKAVLELIGYTLMSHARHERFIMLIGPGANGKSVLLAVLEALCGTGNVAGVQPSKFHEKFQRAHLHQKLANIVTELKQGEVIADAELKAITSGEPATVEHKFKDPFVMHPFATCWFGTNHMPHTRDFSEALFRRATILQFNRTFTTEEQDPTLKDKLAGELPGILNMALGAYARAVAEGFTAPASSEDAKREWRLEADQVAQFVDDACQRDPTGRVQSSEVFARYKVWADQNGIGRTMSQKGLRDRLTRLGFGAERDMYGRYVTGVRMEAGRSWQDFNDA